MNGVSGPLCIYVCISEASGSTAEDGHGGSIIHRMTLEELLEAGILYAVGEAPARTEDRGFQKYSMTHMPGTIRLRCSTEKCSKIMDWRIQNNSEFFGRPSQFTYRCVQCDEEVTFFVNGTFERKEANLFAVITLAGRCPRSTGRIGEELKRALNKTDVERRSDVLYAPRCRR